MTTSPYPSGIRPWMMWGLGALFFFTMYIARVSPGVMTIPLMEDFQVTAFEFSIFSLFFFCPYVIMQIPVGVLVDKFSTRWLLTAMILLCAFACYLFGNSSQWAMACFSRLVMGFSAAFGFVSALKLASVWLPPQRFGLLAGLTQALGMLGASIGQQVIATSLPIMGWRNTLFMIGAALVILAMIVAIFVRDYPKNQQTHHPRPSQSWKDIGQGVMRVFVNRQTWINGLYLGLLYAPMATFAELWGNSFLIRVYGMDLESAALGIALIFIGWGIGGPIMGGLSDYFRRRRPFMWFSASASCVIMTIILYIPNLPISVLYTLLFTFGLSNPGVVVAYAVAGEINPHRVAGTSLGVANMLTIIIGALMFQPIVGKLMDISRGDALLADVAVYTAQDYYTALSILPVSLVLAFIAVFFIKETRCETLESQLASEEKIPVAG